MIAERSDGLQNVLHMSMTPTRRPSVAVVVSTNGTERLGSTLAAVEQQVYEPGAVAVVGSATAFASEGHGQNVSVAASLSDAVTSVSRHAEYVWFLSEGAVPTPDALRAALVDADRAEASIVGSKIIGEKGSLVSVGLVTDVFGVPYTGIDISEIDQGQYDVVRDVAAVSGTSMLVRTDLLAGLGGIDEEMTRQPAAIDLAQRARLKGARIVISPASVVFYDTDAADHSRWRAEAGRIRGVLKVYGPLTLLWIVPLDFIMGIVEMVVSLFLGRWLVGDFVKAWGLNLMQLPNTISARQRARKGRVVGDEELFRYQRRGSVKMVRLGAATTKAVQSKIPGEDKLSIESIGDELRRPVFVVGVLAVLFVLLAARNLWSDGFPAVGYTLPFPSDGGNALSGYAGGWNPAGLGSPDALRPLIAIAALAKMITLNAPTFPEYALGAGALLAGIWGVTALLRTWSVAAAPGLIAGIVYVAGPASQGISGNTDIGTLLALGVFPWVLRLALKPVRGDVWIMLSRGASIVLALGLLGALSPLMLLVPAPVILIYALARFKDGDAWRGFVLTLVGTAGGALLLSPWIWTANFSAIARAGYAYWHLSSVVAVAGAVVAVAAVVASKKTFGVPAAWASVLIGVGLLGSRSGDFGFGVETESVSLALLSLGIAIAIGITAHGVSQPGRKGWRRFVLGGAGVGIVVLIVASLTIVLGGRIGLPGDRFKSAFEFTLATDGEAEISRILVVGPRDLLPGDSRTIQGGTYRVVSAPFPDLGEVRLAQSLPFDDLLAEKLRQIVSGETRRAGGELAVFGIRWIVVMGDSRGSDADEISLAWRDVFAGQLDLLPLTAAISNAVFVTDISSVSRALTNTGTKWPRNGWNYSGEPEPSSRLFLAENADEGWGPGPRVTTEQRNELSAELGVAIYTPDVGARTQGVFVLMAVVILIGFVVWGRRRS